MKPQRSFVLAALIAMVLFAVAVSVAQTQTDQKKATAASCCAMDSCCCHGDSCAMKAGEKTDTAKGGCCCGDSCDMTKKHDANHASKEGCCCGDHTMTAQGNTQAANATSTKHECCAAMANNMTAKHDMKNMKTHDMKNHDMKDGCCCSSDSCDMDMKKTAN